MTTNYNSDHNSEGNHTIRFSRKSWLGAAPSSDFDVDPSLEPKSSSQPKRDHQNAAHLIDGDGMVEDEVEYFPEVGCDYGDRLSMVTRAAEVARYVADCSNLEFERDALKSRVDRLTLELERERIIHQERVSQLLDAVRTEHAQTVSEKDQLLRYATQAIIALEATGAKCANDLRDMTMLRDMALNEKTESEAKYQDRIREATEMISYGLEMSRQCMDALPRFENGREPGLPLILRSSARDAFLGF